MRLYLILFALVFVAPIQAESQLQITWRDAATIRVDWSGAGCVFVEDRATGLCGAFGSKLVPFGVYVGQRVELRSAEQVLASSDIPDNPFPLPVTATWANTVLHITIANPSPNRCLMLIGGGKLDTFLPGSCGVATYDLPAAGGDANYAPAGRILRLVESGNIIYDLPVPARSIIYLPIVTKE